MRLAQLGFSLLITAAGSALLASPLAPDFCCQLLADTESRVLLPEINGIYDLEPDFFDQGYDVFELEIERLMQQQHDPNVPLLTIDDSALFDADSLENLETLETLENSERLQLEHQGR